MGFQYVLLNRPVVRLDERIDARLLGHHKLTDEQSQVSSRPQTVDETILLNNVRCSEDRLVEVIKRVMSSKRTSPLHAKEVVMGCGDSHTRQPRLKATW